MRRLHRRLKAAIHWHAGRSLGEGSHEGTDELGHIRQQPELTTNAPLTVSASTAHEHNADLLLHGATRTALPMPGNVVACNPTSRPPPLPTSDYHDGLHQLIAERHPEMAKQGGFGGGVEYKVQKNGTFVVTFPPSPGGHVIIHDADDVTDIGKPSDGKAPPYAKLNTGEVAVQRETKKLVAYNTAVTATYKPEDIEYNKFGKPIGIKNFKPITVSATTGRNGVLVQNERNVTTVGAATADGKSNTDPRLIRTIDKEKKITGDNEFYKQPGTEKDLMQPESKRKLNFNKLEQATVRGRVIENATTLIEDKATGHTSKTKSESDFHGKSTSARGKAQAGPDGQESPYVLDNQSIGEKTESSIRVQTYPLPSGRLMVVEQGEKKHSLLTKGVKELDNYGIELQARLQEDARVKEGLEDNFKKTKTTFYVEVPLDPKKKDGLNRLVPISEATARSFAVSFGFNRVGTKEDTTRRRLTQLPIATKSDDAHAEAITLNASIVNETGQGVAATNLAGSIDVGKKRNYKSTSGPDVAAQGGKPFIGKADLATKKLYHSDNLDANVALTDMGVAVDGLPGLPTMATMRASWCSSAGMKRPSSSTASTL